MCTEHKTKHVCGPAHCDARVTDAWGLTSCGISGLVFSYGQCTGSDEPDAVASTLGSGSGSGSGSSAATASGSGLPPRAPDAVRRAAAARRATEAVRETCRDVVRALLPAGAVHKWCARSGCEVSYAEHFEAYVDEAARTWVELEGAGRAATAAVHALGVMLLMAKGECFAAGASAGGSGSRKDALLDACLLSLGPASGALFKVGDGTKGKNSTRAAIYKRDAARFRMHADVLKHMTEERAKSEARARAGETLRPDAAAQAAPTRPAEFAVHELVIPTRARTGVC